MVIPKDVLEFASNFIHEFETDNLNDIVKDAVDMLADPNYVIDPIDKYDMTERDWERVKGQININASFYYTCSF